MNKKQRKMLFRIIIAAVFLVLLNFIPVECIFPFNANSKDESNQGTDDEDQYNCRRD